MLDRQDRNGCQDKRGLTGRSARPVGLGFRIENQQGFTLIELVLTIILVGIIAGMASVFLRQGLNAFVAEDARADITNQGRLAIERMAREMRMIRSRTAADLPGCCTNPSTTFNFIDMSGSNITYSLTGNTITRNLIPLAAGDVVTVDFRHYQQDGVTLAATAAQVWSIQVDLTVTKSGESQAYRVRVHPRNFV